jgi:glycosyltransferase involved in cell wall biosynthesis
LQLTVLGRNSEEAGGRLQSALDGAPLRVSVLGLLPAAEVARALSSADALLFVRGHVSSRRTSAIAGIACGLPVVAYRGEETGFPITEAGVVLVDQGDHQALADALCRVLTDDEWRQELCRRNVRAQRTHFSWEAIARRFLEALND